MSRASQRSVTVLCPDCGAVHLAPGDVFVTCVREVARGVAFRCPTCDQERTVSAGPGALSLLHRFGVGAVALEPGEAEDVESPEPERLVVSLQILLDEPDLVLRVASTSATRQHPPPATTV